MISIARQLRYKLGRATQRVVATDFTIGFGRASRIIVRDPPGGVFPFANGHRTMPDVALLLAELRPHDVVFDVGANIGLYSLAMWDHEQRIRLHAFEPSSSTFEWLVANRRCNDAPWQCHKVAVGDRDGWTRMSCGLGAYNHVVVDDVKSAEACAIVTLDTYTAVSGIGEVAVLKVDVEGYEVPVLAGAARLVRERRIRFLLLENDGHQRRYRYGLEDYGAYLQPHGYVRIDDRAGNFEAWRRS